MGTYRSFVEPILGKFDIAVSPYSLATKVVFDGKKAVGVMVKRFGQTYYYKVSFFTCVDCKRRFFRLRKSLSFPLERLTPLSSCSSREWDQKVI